VKNTEDGVGGTWELTDPPRVSIRGSRKVFFIQRNAYGRVFAIRQGVVHRVSQ